MIIVVTCSLRNKNPNQNILKEEKKNNNNKKWIYAQINSNWIASELQFFIHRSLWMRFGLLNRFASYRATTVIGVIGHEHLHGVIWLDTWYDRNLLGCFCFSWENGDFWPISLPRGTCRLNLSSRRSSQPFIMEPIFACCVVVCCLFIVHEDSLEIIPRIRKRFDFQPIDRSSL